MPDDSSARGAGDDLLDWLEKPVPEGFFERLRGQVIHPPHAFSPLDVLKAGVFWRSLPFRWNHCARDGQKLRGILLDQQRLIWQHHVAQNVIIRAAQSQGMDFAPIIESGRTCLTFLLSHPERFDLRENGTWPACLSDSARAEMGETWGTLTAAERFLGDLEQRMQVKLWRTTGGGQMQGHDVLGMVIGALAVLPKLDGGSQLLGGAAMRVPVTPDEAVPEKRRTADEAARLAGEALSLLAKHSDWSQTRIARELGISRSYLQELRGFRGAWDRERKGKKTDMRRRHGVRDGHGKFRPRI